MFFRLTAERKRSILAWKGAPEPKATTGKRRQIPGTLITCIYRKTRSHGVLACVFAKWADAASPAGGQRRSAPWPSFATATPGRPRPLPREPSPSSHPMSSAAAASSASSSRNVSSAGSYTLLKAPRPTCPCSGVGRPGAAIFLLSIPRACAKVARAQARQWGGRGAGGGEANRDFFLAGYVNTFGISK